MSVNWVPSSLPDLDGELEQDKVTGLPDALAAKADDASVVKLATPQVITSQKTHTDLLVLDYAGRAGQQINTLKILGDNVNPPFAIGHSSQYSGDPAKGWNFVVPIGHNVNGQAGLYDPTQPAAAFVQEGNFFSDVFTPAEPSFEQYLSIIWPDGTVVRPIFANTGKTSKTAIVGLICSRFSTGREDQASLLNFVWNATAGSLNFNLVIPGKGSCFGVGGNATSDSISLGSSSNTGTNIFLNTGAAGQVDQYWTLNNVNKFKHSLSAAAGGTYSLYDPTGIAVAADWVTGGKSYHQRTQRTFIGYSLGTAATAQLEVLPTDPALQGFLVVGASGQTANYLQVQAWTGAKFLAVNGSGKVAIGDGAPIAKVLSATATLDFGSIAAGASATLTMTVTGAVAGSGSSLDLGPPAALESGLTWCGKVSATDTVSITLFNATASPIDPVSAIWRATVRTF